MDDQGQHIDWRLLAGDALAILGSILIGLQYHEGSTSFLSRVTYNFFAWFLAWLSVGFALGIFDFAMVNGWKRFGRLVWTMLLAAPFATLLRAAWLGQTALPIFALVMGLVTLAALLIWRLIFGTIAIKIRSDE
ncbi:MAG: DUF3054 family protein [Chloroflexi bacterium]|nr:DUF3054 family protein [Chloroflexota bacterium]